MKAQKVMKVLNISRQTLFRWNRDGKIKATQLPSGQYDYDDDSVYEVLNQGKPRITCVYGRVSTYSQINDLKNQMTTLQDWAGTNGYVVDKAFQDVASGISFDKRKQFFQLLDLVINYKVKTVIITYKDRLSRVGFDLFSHLFSQFGCQIIVISDLHNPKTDQQEIFEEIISLLHSFSMRLYSRRRNKKNSEGR